MGERDLCKRVTNAGSHPPTRLRMYSNAIRRKFQSQRKTDRNCYLLNIPHLSSSGTIDVCLKLEQEVYYIRDFIYSEKACIDVGYLNPDDKPPIDLIDMPVF